MPDGFQVEMLIPAEPQRVFTAWLALKLSRGAQAVWAPTGQLARDHRVRERAA